MSVVVSSIHVYPIKACAPLPLYEAEVAPRGLRDDRRYMLVDPAGRFVSQREHQELGTFRVRLERDDLIVEDELAVPRALPDGPRCEVTVFGQACQAMEHEAGSAWFSRRAGRPLRLVYQPDDALRPVSPAHGRPGDHVSFADGYPVLLASENSRVELERRAGVSLAMARFRPNVVVVGAASFEEDRWSELRLGAVAFRNVKPCERCVVTTYEPTDRSQSKEPLRTLATFREKDGAVWFGANLVPDGPGVLRIGDPVEITRIGPSLFDRLS